MKPWVPLLVLAAALALPACGPADPAAAECAGATISGTDGDDVLVGTDGPDVIDGGEGNDRIRGLGGDDVLCGGPGSDTLVGGEGDDRLFGQQDERQAADTDYYEWYGDRLSGGPGDDLLDGGLDDEGDETRVSGDSVDYRRSSAPIRLDLAAGTATGEGRDTIVAGIRQAVGSAHADVLLGTENADRLSGWGGRDRIEGLGGNDMLESTEGLRETRGAPDSHGAVLVGGDGNDQLIGSHGPDVLVGGNGSDWIQASYGADQIDAGGGQDHLGDMLDASGDQRIDGGPGRDELMEFFLVRPDGKDAATSGEGTVDLAAGRLVTTVNGVPVTVPLLGIEDAYGTYGHWTLIGTDGPNALHAGFDDTTVVIRAGGGDDELSGGFDHDDLDGGDGRDTLYGSPGDDRVVSIEKTI